ncbi:four-carbon acid sugar kinase family protein [Pseudoclavibacter helvolus]|uniref:four-carbon acid sugar kinase family protein n=1 Tax=Pseudoclavibacter helvolus TaxID=255205 RepID=UPI003C70DE96
MTRPTVVILDDDPTGTQAVADIPVITSPTPENLRWAFDTSPLGFFVLTNTRSLDEPAMVALTKTIVTEVIRAAGSRPVRFVSRSDSTLRGHIFAEPAAIRSALREVGAPAPAMTVFVPAFPRAGRITRDGVHLLRDADGEAPAHESHFAQDATFGYTTSFLPELVAERSSGDLTSDDIVVVTPDRVASGVREARGSWLACDAEDDADLATIAAALSEADPNADRTLIRASPGILPALLGLPVSTELPRHGAAPHAGGLIIVGSHVAQTTRQLARLLEEPDVTLLELDVDDLVDANAAAVDAIIERLASHAAAGLASSHVVIATGRVARTFSDPDRSLAFARRVSDTLVAVTRRTMERFPVAFVVAKGGITSSDIATRAMRIERAIVRGRVGAGIVWQPADDTTRIPLALVPGNIGDDEGLVEAVRGVSYQRSSAE